MLEVARLAGIMAAKRTADLIPLCHPLAIESVTVDFTSPDDRTLVIGGTVARRSQNRRRNGGPHGGFRRGPNRLRYVQIGGPRHHDRTHSTGRKIGRPQRTLAPRHNLDELPR